MAKIDLVKEYDEWKKKRDSREYNYNYNNGVSSDDLVGEYNSWKKNYEASQQRVKPAAQLSQPFLSAPSPIMSATMKLNDPRSANYLDNLADTYAANAWYKRSPEAHASDARNYAATVGAAAKYDGMSYADRLAALEELKTNLRNAPNPEQGAEYQYLKNNLAWAETSPEASHYRTQQATRQKNAAEEYIADAKKQTEQQNEAYNELDSEYGNSRYWQLAQYRGQAASRGEEDRVEQINQQIRDYADSIKGSREAELINLIEQPYDSEEIAAGSARAKAYSSGTQKKFDDANIILHADGDKSSLYTLALKGAGIASTGNEYEDYKRFVETLGGENRFPLYISDSDLNKVRDTIAGEYSPTTDSSNANYKQVSLEERAMYYALLGKGKKYEAADYINSLRNDLFQRAKSASAQRRAERIKSEGPVVGTLDAAFQSVMSVPGQVLGGITSGLDLLGQYATTGEYDPYKNPEMHLMQNEANEARGAVGQVLRDVTGGEVAPFIYNAVMSAVDSTAGALLGNELAPLASGAVTKSLAQNAYTFIMGSGAASQRAEELYLRGANNVQILYGSLTAGIIESLFEEVSLDKLVHPEECATKLLRILGQAGIEASEEMATDLANNIAGIALGDKSDIETEIRALLSENPNMTYEEAQRTAYGHALEEIIESGLAGGLSGGLSAGAYDIANGVRYNRQNNKIGKNISSNYQAENTVKQGLEADENSEAYKLAKDIDERQKAGKTVSNKALGELARALDTELTEKSGNALEKASEYRREAAAAETVENALKENGATDEEAADLAPLVSKSILGEELTDAEQTKIDNNTAAVRYMDEVGSKTSEISGETGLQQLALRVNATTRGQGSTKANETVRESNLQKVFENAMSQKLEVKQLSKNEVDDANKTTLTLSDNGKTTYNGETVEIARPVTVDGENTTVELENGETVKLKDVSFGSRNEAVVWEVLSGVDGMSAESLSEFVAAAEKIPAGVSAGVWARGIAEGYSIGKADILGTREFPKAESRAKYLSNAGQDARRLSEELGRRDMRESRRQASISEERTAANTKENETKSEQVKRATDMLDRLGRKYEVKGDITGDGYIESDGTIVLNDKAKDPLGFVVKHELTHYGETSKYYGDFVAAVKKSKAFAEWLDRNVTRDGTQAQQEASYINAIRDRYQRHGVRLTNTTAHNEMIANFVGDTLFNENGVGLDGITSGLEVKDRNAIMRFLNKLADFFRKHFTKGGERAYLEHFFNQLQSTATGERTEEKTYTFAGENAATSNVQTLSEAKELIEQGADPEEVRQQTGWFKGMDGKWRFEIDDSRVKLNTEFIPQDLRDLDLAAQEYYNEVKTRNDAVIDKMNALARNGATTGDPEFQKLWKESLRLDKKLTEADRFLQRARSNSLVLSDILVHPALYKAYPSLKNKRITLEYKNNSYLGQSRSDDLGIVVEGQHKEDILSTILHEVQHEMQKIEGFAKGSNPQWWAAQLSAQNEDIKKAETTKTGIQKKLEAIPYSGNQQASPLASAIMYAYLNRQLREDRRSNATASMKYDTMKIGQIEQRAKEGGYYELLDEYNKAEQDFEIAKAEAQRGISQNAYNKYFATAGEIEARDASARKNLTNEERRAKRPDIDRKDVVFAEGNEKTYSIAETENDEKYLSAVNSGDMETAQRMVDEAAKAAGYTYHLYHGTKAKFNKFDPRKFGGSNGKGEGYGIYLASNKEISAPYGDNLIDSYVKFERLAEGTKRTLKTAEVRNIIKASCEAEARQSVKDGEYDSLADALKDSWVSNYVYTYDYQGMNQVYTDVADKILKSNDNDGDIINEIMIASGAHYNYSAALDFYDNILTPITGIDGFHYVWGKGTDNANDIYLAFRSEQIKRSDPVTYDDKGNVIPLSERFNEGNEDIRWSIPETAERERAQSIKQIERLNETVTHLRDMLKLQRTQTHGTVMTQASVARQADRLMDRWDVYVGKGELTKLLNTFYTTVAQKINQREATWEEVVEAAEPVVDFLLSKQVTETEDESVKNVVNYLKGKAIRLNDQQRAEIKHVYGSVTAWQKAIAGTVKLRNDGIALDSLWQEASELHPDWFDPDVTSDADMPIRLAETAKQLQDSLWMEQELPGEAWEETKRDILYDVYETFFDAAPIQTLADKQAKEISELRAKAYAKIEQVKDAASTRIQNLKEADRERYERLRKDKNAKIEEVKAEARERRQRERERRKKSQLRSEIKDRISEFNDKLLHPGKNKYVPMEFVRSVAGFLKDIDIGAKPGTKVSEKLAALKVKYDALKNDKYYNAAYNEQIGNLLQTVATEIGDTPLPKMSAYQLELLNNMLRALNHRIEHAVSVDRISKSKNAFEYARELINELNAVDRRAITGTTAGKLLDMQVRPQTMFERFAGFKKNSYWSQLYDALDAAQLRETQLSMEAQQMFTDLLNDRKNYKKLADSVDIGLTDEEGNPVLISRGMMLSIRRALMNADNTRHIVGGGFTVPDFDLYYKGNTGKAFNKKGKRVFGFAADMADIAHQIGELRETMAEQEAAGESTAETETKIADLESQFNELKDRSNAYAAQLAATIDDQLTMYEQNLLSMADVFFDEWSKDILNEATLAVYGFKKANVEKYFPIKVDNNYTETKFDTFSNDISLENAGFMKDRVMSSKPILLQDITDVISDQIKKVSRYAAYLEVLDDFKRIYNVTLPGSSDSVQDALGKRFAGEEGKKFIENLLQDIQGGRRGGSVTLFDKARGKLAAATLTLNARVALAQAASFPTAAAELGWAPIMKALGKTFKKTDKELIMKYSPLLAYRSWGFSSTEIGDARRIKDIRHKVDSKLRWLTGWITSVDSYTVGHLWYAAEYYVDANNKDLEKGSEKYYEEVAKVFNRTIEKTQPNYTTLQRPELMRTDNALVKQLSMFMTQRLQNVNILYEAFARYDKYKEDFKAGKNGVTREDVIEARKARTRAIESQIIAAATISIIKNLTDMLLHSFKKRDDDDDYDLTDAEWNLLDAFCDSLISNVVLGSEAYSFLKSKITGDRYYGISLGGVGAITETVDDVSDFIDATKKAFAGSEMNWNAAKQLGYSMSRLMGIPVQNAVKYVTAVSEWVQDAKADQFNHGNYIGKTGVRLYLSEGRTKEAIDEINAQQAKGVDMQSTVRDFYKPLYLDAKKRGDTTEMAEIGRELSKIIDETGVYKNSADKVLAGWVSQDEKAAKEK